MSTARNFGQILKRVEGTQGTYEADGSELYVRALVTSQPNSPESRRPVSLSRPGCSRGSSALRLSRPTCHQQPLMEDSPGFVFPDIPMSLFAPEKIVLFAERKATFEQTRRLAPSAHRLRKHKIVCRCGSSGFDAGGNIHGLPGSFSGSGVQQYKTLSSGITRWRRNLDRFGVRSRSRQRTNQHVFAARLFRPAAIERSHGF